MKSLHDSKSYNLRWQSVFKVYLSIVFKLFKEDFYLLFPSHIDFDINKLYIVILPKWIQSLSEVWAKQLKIYAQACLSDVKE